MIKNSKQSGFSLVETLVAITILLVVIAGPLAISSSASKSSSFSSEQVVAFFLAQEGLELAQKVRSDLLIQHFPPINGNDDPWNDFIDTAGVYGNCHKSQNASGCDLTINGDGTGTITVTNCVTTGACLLSLDKVTGNKRSRFNHDLNNSNNVATPFTRTITFETVGANEIKIISKVTWRTGSLRAGQEVVAETRLFNTYGF
jgi:prepilin-type N-terminal cleavage/methylation domain-containing protein